MAANAGRTVTKWIRFGVDDSLGTAREIPINSISPVGFVWDETELTAWQDAVKGYLTNHPDCPIEISGPWDNIIVAGFAASAATPTLSGSHTVLSGIVGGNTPLALAVHFGVRHYWETGEPVFGIIAAGAATGYLCTKYSIEGESYSARFVPYPGSIPAWGTAIIS
jgi:hypothetical protein